MARRGEALDLSEAEMKRAAQITPSDLGEARAWGRRYLPVPFGGMLEAETLDVDRIREIRRANGVRPLRDL